ncbi:hypothetical protein ACS0TY_036206 [Phlomoides rotata]
MNSKKSTAETMVVLDDDMILEIVVRLPLKCAIRCMILNKNLFHLISQQKKALLALAYPDIEGRIFCRFDDDTFTKITPRSSEISIRAITIPKRSDPKNPIILDSCNGVLLLNFVTQSKICVFNPITGGIMLVNPFIRNKLNAVTVALAVDLDAQTIFQFKLVVAETFYHSEEENLWTFTVLVPFDGTSWLIKSPVELICSCRGSPSRFVYVHGCVYWADEMNHILIMFDVEKETARSIDWPDYSTECIAFLAGSSCGSLLSVYTLENETEIHSYDQVKDEWQLQHKITKFVSNPGVLFCNGQHLLIADYPSSPTLSRLRMFRNKVLYMYDILSDKWEEISAENFSFRIINQKSFVSFVPTLAKVSDKYLHDPEFEFAEVYLRGLQCLVMQEARDVEVIE